MNYKFKAQINSHQNREGKHNVMVRIYVKQGPGKYDRKFAKTDYYVSKKQFDSKKGKVQRHPLANAWNAGLEQLITTAQTRVMQEKARGRYLSIDQVKAIVEGTFHSDELDLFTFADRFISAKYDKAENYSRLRTIQFFLKILREYTGGKLSLYEITPIWLHEFNRYMKKELAVSTVNIYLSVLKTILKAAKQDSSLQYNEDPFAGFKMNKEDKEMERIALTDEEIIRIERLTGLTEFQTTTRDFFLAMYYAGGLRPSDMILLKVGDYLDAKSFKAKKTRNKIGGIVSHPKLDKLLQPYLAGKSKSDYIFPYMPKGLVKGTEGYEHVLKNAGSSIYHAVLLIGEKAMIPIRLTPKTARRTFLSNVNRRLGKQYAKGIGLHTDEKTTEAYLEHVNHLQEAIEVVVYGK